MSIIPMPAVRPALVNPENAPNERLKENSVNPRNPCQEILVNFTHHSSHFTLPSEA